MSLDSAAEFPAAYNKLLDQNIRTGSLVAYWCLKSHMIRLCAAAFHKWVRCTHSGPSRIPTPHLATGAASASAPAPTTTAAEGDDDVMSEEMEAMRRAAVGSRTRRNGVSVAMTSAAAPTPPASSSTAPLSVNTDPSVAAAPRTSSAAATSNSTKAGASEQTVDAFAAAVHDAIVDGKRNLLLSLARDIISGAALTTSSLSLLDHSLALEEMEQAGTGAGTGPARGARPFASSPQKPQQARSRSSDGGADRDGDGENYSDNGPRGRRASRAMGRASVSMSMSPLRGGGSRRRSSSSKEPQEDRGAGQGERSRSVGAAARRSSVQPMSPMPDGGGGGRRGSLVHEHSIQYQRIQLMKQMKAAAAAAAVGSSSGSGSSSYDASHPHYHHSVYAFGSSTSSDRNIAEQPANYSRNEIIYNPDHYRPQQHHKFSAVPSSGYGQHPSAVVPVVPPTARGRSMGGGGGRVGKQNNYLTPTHSSWARASNATAASPALSHTSSMSRSNSNNALSRNNSSRDTRDDASVGSTRSTRSRRETAQASSNFRPINGGNGAGGAGGTGGYIEASDLLRKNERGGASSGCDNSNGSAFSANGAGGAAGRYAGNTPAHHNGWIGGGRDVGLDLSTASSVSQSHGQKQPHSRVGVRTRAGALGVAVGGGGNSPPMRSGPDLRQKQAADAAAALGKPPKGMDRRQWLLLQGINPHDLRKTVGPTRGGPGRR